MTKESGAGIPGTSWAVTAASPGPLAIMGSWRIIGFLAHHQPSRERDIAFPCHPSHRRSIKSYRATIVGPVLRSTRVNRAYWFACARDCPPGHGSSQAYSRHPSPRRQCQGQYLLPRSPRAYPDRIGGRRSQLNQITRPAEPARIQLIHQRSVRSAIVRREKRNTWVIGSRICVSENDGQD